MPTTTGPASDATMTDIERDIVDSIVDDWLVERPELDFLGLHIYARILRLERILYHRGAKLLERNDLTVGELNVLMTLRRTGDPFELTNSELGERMLLSVSGTTHRVDKLARHGFIERRRDPEDRRVVWVCLTETGRELVDEAIQLHVAWLTQQFSNCDRSRQQELVRLLRELLVAVESQDRPGP